MAFRATGLIGRAVSSSRLPFQSTRRAVWLRPESSALHVVPCLECRHARRYAQAAPSVPRGAKTPPIGPTSLSSTYERLLPPSIPDEKLPLARETIHKVIERILAQLVEATKASSIEEGDALEAEAEQEIVALLAADSTAALLQTAIVLLQSSQDPRRNPIAHRLTAIASGVRPSTWATEKSSDAQADQEALGLWASLILQGVAAPPAGSFGASTPADARIRARAQQRADAIMVLARLAREGHPRGLYGFAMIRAQALEAGGMREGEQGTPDPAVRAKAVKEVLDMWTQAGEKGVAEAWFELGRIHLAGELVPQDSATAATLFTRGAEAGHSRSHHALGVLHSQAASSPSMPSPTSFPSLPREQHLSLAHAHFLAGANAGDPQCAHNLAVRLLIVDEDVNLGIADSEGVRKAEAAHVERWGIAPDDKEARRWFTAAARRGFPPAMMNLAAMLVGGRGRPENFASVEGENAAPTATEAAHRARLEELRDAETLYMRIQGLAGSGSDAATNPPPGSPDSASGQQRSMGEFAGKALEEVQKLIKKEMEGEEGER